MKNLTSPRRVFLAALAAAALIGCKPSENSSSDGGGGNAGGDILVGEFASLTGTEAAFGQSSHKGTQLAFEQVNAAGGVLGRKFKHLVEDTQSKAGESATIARKFVSRDKVVAVLGEVASGRSLEAAPVCQQFGVPMISPSSTNPKVTEIGDFIFRVCFIDPFQGKLISEFVTKTLKTKKVAILSDVSSAYSVGLAQYFKESFTASGGQVVIEQKYSNKDKDFKAQLTAIKAAGVDGILVPGYYNEVGLIVKQARELGVMVPMFGGDGWEAQELIQIAGGEALQNTYYSTHFSPANQAPEAQSFVEAYKARFHGETPDAMAALGYDSARALVEAIKKAGTTEGKKLKEALAAIDFVGATGRTKLDAKRDAAKPAVIITTEGGKFKFLQSIEP